MNTAVLNSLFWLSVLVPAFVLWRPSSSSAQDEIIDLLKRQMAEMQGTMKKMAERLEQLEKERASANGKMASVEQSVKTMQSAPSALNPAIGMALDMTAEHRAKTGGTFNFRSAEIGLAASIDPYARAYAFFNGSGEGVEVEEAAIVTTSLPWNLQARGGRFFADFGRSREVSSARVRVRQHAAVVGANRRRRITGGWRRVELSFPDAIFLARHYGRLQQNRR